MALKPCPSCGQNNPGDAANCLHCEHIFPPETIEKPKPGFSLVKALIVAGALALVVLFVQQQLEPEEPGVSESYCIDAKAEPAEAQRLVREGFVEGKSRGMGMTCFVKYGRGGASPAAAPAAPAATGETLE